MKILLKLSRTVFKIMKILLKFKADFKKNRIQGFFKMVLNYFDNKLTVKLKRYRLMHLILIPAAFLMLHSYLVEYHNLTMLKLSINSIPPCWPRSSPTVV